MKGLCRNTPNPRGLRQTFHLPGRYAVNERFLINLYQGRLRDASAPLQERSPLGEASEIKLEKILFIGIPKWYKGKPKQRAG